MSFGFFSTPDDGIAYEEINKVLKEITKGDDRACAVVAAAFLEIKLKNCLRRMFVQDAKELNELYDRETAPLGPFKTKARFGYLMGVYGKDTFRDLKLIIKIRNKFAHQIAVRKFEHEAVRSDCMNLKTHKRYVRDAKNTPKEPDKTEALLKLSDYDYWISYEGYENERTTSRGCYLATVQALMYAFSFANVRSPGSPQF